MAVSFVTTKSNCNCAFRPGWRCDHFTKKELIKACGFLDSKLIAMKRKARQIRLFRRAEVPKGSAAMIVGMWHLCGSLWAALEMWQHSNPPIVFRQEQFYVEMFKLVMLHM